MDIVKYQEIVDKYKPKEPKIKNLLISFLIGGLIGVLGNFLIDFYSYLGFPTTYAQTLMIITLIFITCLFTALGFFDNFVKFAKMGLIIPITGFAHSMQSSTLDHKKEGLIYGIGSNMFNLAGSVILYGVVTSFIVDIIRYLIGG